MSRSLASLPCLTLLAACSVPTQPLGGGQPGSSLVPEAAWLKAEQQADRFDGAFRSGGMAGVATDVQNCYASALHSEQQVAVRDCLVYDDFADRFAAQVDSQKYLGIPAYFQKAAVYPRLSRYSGPAGFSDPEIMSGYLNQGANTIFAVIVARTTARS